VDYDSIIPQNQDRPLFKKTLVKFNYLVGMIADQNFYDIFFTFFYPTASATAYGRRPKFVRAEYLATAEGENCAYGPTLIFKDN
jgi:hypothetical protein